MKRPFKKQATKSLLFLGFTLVLLLVWLFLSSPEKSFLEVIKDLALTFLLPVGLTLLIPISILGIMFLFHKLFPLSQQEPIQLGEEEQNDYAKIYLSGTFLFFLGWPIGGILSYFVLSWFSDLWGSTIKAVYLAPLDRAFWSGPAMFLGILFGGLFSSVILNLWNKQKYQNTQRIYELIVANEQLESREGNPGCLSDWYFGDDLCWSYLLYSFH